MTQTSNKHPLSPCPPSLDAAQLTSLSEVAAPLLSARFRDPGDPAPISHIFTINPNVDTESLLCHASETLASLNAMSTDLAYELEGSRRNVALAIQQLAVLGELLVNRVLDNLEQPTSPPKVS